MGFDPNKLVYVVEGQFRAVPSDAESSPWEAVAAFKYEQDAKDFIRGQENANGESAYVDRMWVRMAKKALNDRT